MNHNKWFLFARIEDHIPQADTLAKFFQGAGEVLGKKIKNTTSLELACYMYRLHGDWLELLREIVFSAPRHIIDQLPDNYKHKNGRIGTRIHLFYRYATAREFSTKHIWDFDSRVRYGQYGGQILHLNHITFPTLICGKIDDHGKLMRSRLIALMHGCKRRGIDAGLRRAMCYLTHNLIIDYIICFNMICGKNVNDLQKNVSYFLPERPTKRAVKIQTDSLARAATLQCLRDGYDNYNYARVVFSGIVGKQVEISKYVLYWVYCRGVGKSIPKLDAEKQEFHYDIDKIFLYLYKHMFSEALELRLLQFDSKTCITPLSIRFAYIDLLENTDNLTEAITERIPKTHEAYNLFLTWAQMDKETQLCYNDILRR